MKPAGPRTILVLSTLVVAAGCATGGGRPRPLPTAGDRFFVAGYHPYWTPTAWRDYPFDLLDRLYFFEIEVGPDGSLSEPHGWPDEWLDLIRYARDAGVDVVPTISLHGVEPFQELFASPERTEHLLDECLSLLAATPGLGGLHLDFEVFRPVEPEIRDGFTAFVARLRQRMREADASYILSSFVLAFDDDDVYSEPELAELTDYLVVQGYDYHSVSDPNTGPVAALRGWGRLNWGYVVDRFIGFGVPPRKIVMAVPMYGYEWPTESGDLGSTTRSQGVEILLAPAVDVMPELARAPEVAARVGLLRDPQSGSPYYAFQDQGGWHQGWFEDAESLAAKYAFVRERGLGGVAIFPLAYGDATLWSQLREAFKAPRR